MKNMKLNFFLKKQKAHHLNIFCLSTLVVSFKLKFRFLYQSIASFKIVFHRIDFANMKSAEINLLSTEFHLLAVPWLRLWAMSRSIFVWFPKCQEALTFRTIQFGVVGCPASLFRGQRWMGREGIQMRIELF